MKDDVMGDSTRKHSNSAKLGLQREHWTTWFGHPVYTSVSGHLTAGNLQIQAGLERDRNQAGAKTHGSFGYGDLNLLTNIGLTEKLALSLSANAQKAFGKNLDSSEQINVTGSGRVRAYRESASGDNGYNLSAELRYTLPSPADKLNHAIGAFVDKGGWATEDKWSTWGRNSDNYADVGLAYYLNYGPASLKVELVQAIGAWHEQEMGPESRTSLNTLFILSY
jgi:hemolysin activation/secretion protein